MTALLFPIGVFPYVMMVSALVFFDTKDVDKVLQKIKTVFRMLPVNTMYNNYTFAPVQQRVVSTLFVVFFVIQFAMPWRYLLNKDELFWTEEGFRFSWRVMLVEKMGYAQFVVKDGVTGEKIAVNNNEFLTRYQERMMAIQPDFILQYAHHLRDYYQQQGMEQPQVYATIYVAMNGRRSRLYADTTVDLAKQTDTWKHKNWILAFNDNIYGL